MDNKDCSAAPANEPMAEALQDGAGKGWMWPTLMALLLTLVVSGAMLVVYHHRVVVPNQVRLAMVDIGEIMDIKQLQLTKAAMDQNLDDEGRGKLYDEVTQFSMALERAVADLQKECGCTLLVRASVVKGDAEDLTEALKARLGMAGTNPPDLAKALAGAGKQGALK